MSHTPGPWKAEHRGDFSLVQGPDGHTLGEVWSELLESDARLMAAAPELLEALTDARYWVGTEVRGDDALEAMLACVSRIEAAIAKAEGK